MKRKYMLMCELLILSLFFFFIDIEFQQRLFGEELPWTIQNVSQIGGWKNVMNLSGNYIYLNEGPALRIFDISGEEVKLINSISLPHEISSLFVDGNYVYAGSSMGGTLTIIDVSNPLEPVIKGSCGLNIGWDSIMGISGNYLYINYSEWTDEGKIIYKLNKVDVSDKSSPKLLKVYDIDASSFVVDSGKIYVIGNFGKPTKKFVVYDLSDLENPVAELTDNVLGPEAMFISGSYLYSACYGLGIQVFDISDPANPSLKTTIDISGLKAEDIVVINKKAYVAGVDSGFYILDLNDLNNVQVIGKIENYNVMGVEMAYPYAYLFCNNYESILKVDVSNPDSLSSKGVFEAPYMANYIATDGKYLYINEAFLWIYDITNIKSPSLVKYYTDLKQTGPLFRDGDYLFSSKDKEFYILDVSKLPIIEKLSTYQAGDSIIDIVVDSGYAYLLIYSGGAEVLNISDKSNPTKISSLDIDGTSKDMYVGQGRAYISYMDSQGNYKVQIFDISDPQNPIKKGTIEPQGKPSEWDVGVSVWGFGELLILGSNDSTENKSYIEVYDVSDPVNLKKKVSIDTPFSISDIQVIDLNGNTVILAGMPGGSIHTYSIKSQDSTTEIIEGPYCPSPKTHSIATYKSSASNYVVIGNDISFGIYVQELAEKGENVKLTMAINPPEAANDGCTTNPSVGVHTYEKGTQVDLTATAVSPWNFEKWTGSVSGTSPNTTVKMDTDKEAIANFVKPVLTLSQGPKNPTCYSEGVAPGSKNVRAIHITLSVNDVDDWKLNSIKFNTSGDGNEKEDISKVYLYQGDETGELLGSGTFSQDDGSISFSVNIVIPKGSSINLMLTYDLVKENNCPCKTYKTHVTVGDIGAEPMNYENYVKLPPPPAGVSGIIEIKLGYIEIDENTNKQYAEKNHTLPQPLRVFVKDIPDSCLKYFKVRFQTGSQFVPKDAKGYMFNNGDTQIDLEIPQNKIVETDFTLGDKTGKYGISASLEMKPDYPYSCECYYTVSPPTFEAYATGIDLVAEHDGLEGDEVGIFLGNVSAENDLTVSFVAPPGKAGEVEYVEFELKGEKKKATASPYMQTFDMSKIGSGATLYVTVHYKDGTEMKDEFSFSGIGTPSWFPIVEKLSTYFNVEWIEEDEKYRVSFNYPGDFVWNDMIPSDILLMGGEDNEANVSFSAWADYHISGKAELGASGNISTTILGHEFKAEGWLKGEFNAQFEFQKGEGVIKMNIPFELPEKGASKTFLVCGVPVTIAVDLGGEVKVFLHGGVILDSKVRPEKITFIPGTDITLEITASVSAVFGLAKLAVKGEPEGKLQIKLVYVTKKGIVDTTFGGELVVPIKVIGSLFWGFTDGELASTELGPYQFGDVSGLEKPFIFKKALSKETPQKILYTSGSIDSDDQGRLIAVWVKDTSQEEDYINPEIAIRTNNGSGWSSPILITDNDLWETDPKVVFLSNGKALAIWTSNDGDKNLSKLNEILAHQDIAFSYYNGSSWTQEALVIDDDYPDGLSDLAYDPSSKKAIAVWVHNGDNSEDLENRSKWSIYYSIFDEETQQWTTPMAVPGTDDGKADFMPAIASDGDGKFMLVWIKDEDGKLFTALDSIQNGSNVDYSNNDCDIYYSIFENGKWATPGKIGESNSFTEQMVDIAFTGSGKAVVVWVEKKGDEMDTLYYSYFNGAQWSTKTKIDESNYFIEDPKIDIKDNVGIVVYRKYAGNDGDIFSANIDLGSLKEVSEPPAPSQLTYDEAIDFNLDMALDNNGKPVILWEKIDSQKEKATTTEGFSNGINMAIGDLKNGELTGDVNVSLMDENQDGKYESIKAVIGADLKAGSYKMKASLYDADGNFIASSNQSLEADSDGKYDFTLIFPGGIINDKKANGPYSVKNIALLDEANASIQSDFSKGGSVSPEATYDQFIEGPLSLDRYLYSYFDKITITLNDNRANLNKDQIDTVNIYLSTSAKPAYVKSIQLKETDVNSGIFKGEVGFSMDSEAENTLLVEDGSVIKALYMDPEIDYTWMALAVWQKGMYLDFKPGWNLMAFPFEPDPNDINEIFKDWMDNIISIWKWSSKDNCWAVSLPDLSDEAASAYIEAKGFLMLETLSGGEGYWLNAKQAFTLKVSGKNPEDDSIELSKGWNLVGLKGGESVEITKLIAGKEGEVISIWKWKDNTWAVYLPSLGAEATQSYANAKGFEVLDKINPGEGFWINAEESIGLKD